MIAQELEENIQFAFRDARARGLEFVTIEHLLLVLLDSRDVSSMLEQLSASRDELREDLEDYLARRVPRASSPGGEPRPTPSFQRVIRRAAAEAKNRKTQVTSINVIASVYDEPDSFGAHYLARRGVNRKRIAVWMRSRANALSEPAADSSTSQQSDANSEQRSNLTRDLTAAAAAGELGAAPLPRREIGSAVLRVLCRKYKSNPILVGEPGVGKTAIVHALAHQVAIGEAPQVIADMEIHEIHVGALVAGTRYRGDFEARMRQLVGELTKRPGALLFIDEIHTLIGAGSVSGGNLDAANILKPALVDGSLRCIGATTPTEYARVFAKDSALARRFQKIDVPEPDDAEAIAILRELRPRLEEHHRLDYRDEALSAAVRLSRRYVANRCLPDKAIDLLDDIGATRVLADDTSPVDAKTLTVAVAKLSGLPAKAISIDNRSALRQLDRKLAKRVFGQPRAISVLSSAVRRARLGFSAPHKPVGSFLFVGPTGVGKTELAVALSNTLGLKLLRYDMSEYMEHHSVSRLIGAPPGYVGYEQAGMLTEQVSGTPHCVLLLDEIEKAHPDIFNLLLQIMDYGTLTDNAGQNVDFSHAIVIMTSNAGATSRERAPLGFGDGDEGASGEQAEIKRLFTPEFRNRLDAQVRFSPLSPAVASKIVAKELASVAERLLEEREVKVSFTKEVQALLQEQGFSKSLGARPLQRAINSLVVDAIVDADLRRHARKGSQIAVSAADGKIKIETLASC